MKSTRLATLCAALGLASFFNLNARAASGSDTAANYTGAVSWTNGSTAGTGFGAWILESSGGANGGSYIGDPTVKGSNLSGVASSGNAFGLYASGFSKASRNFSPALTTNDRFTISLGYKWDNGNKGFNLLNGTNEVFNFNISGSGFSWSGGGSFGTIPWVGARENGAVVNLTFTKTSSGFLYEIKSPQEPALNGVGTITANAGSLTRFEVYVSGAGGDGGDFFFNNLALSTVTTDVVPPILALSANQRLIAIPVGGTYTADAGATAADDVSGDVTSSITNNASTILSLDPEARVTATAGTYTVTYTARDAANNAGTATQTVVVHPVGTFASQYTNVAAPGIFNGWKVDGSGNNALIKTANFNWKLFYYFPEAANTEYLITANNGYDIKWGAGGVRGAGGNANLSPTVNTNGWYVFELNEAADTASLSKFTSTTDADSDGIPDEWEVFYGSQLSPATNNLNPDTIYNESLGGSRTAKQAFEQGLNPIRDGRAPTLNFASGTTAMTLLSLSTNNTGVSNKWEILESDVVATGDSTNETVTVTLETRKLTGTAGLGVDPANIVDTSEASLWKITYAAFDPTGNTTNLVRSIVVGDAAPGWRKLQGPTTNTISTAGSATISGRIWIDGATPGAGQAANITAELGVNSANTDPATWAAGAWKAASFNSGFADGDDEYQATINGADLTAGTYYYAYRFKIGNGSWFYAGMNAAGTDGGPWDGTTNLSGTLVVNPAQVRDVTFALDMRVQQFKNAFVSGEKVVVSGAFNGWGTNNELTLDSGSGLHKATINIEGLEGVTNEFKFRILGTTRTNAGMEYESVSNRALVLGAAGAATNLPTAFFNNLEESRKITFRVDMSVQAAKGNFNTNTGVVQLAGSFNGWSTTATPLSAQGNGVYAAEVTVDGPVSGISYKFLKGTTAADYEVVSDRTISAVLPNLQASTLDVVLFGNDDGVAPTDIALSASSIAENNTVNAVVGILSSTDATVGGDTHTYTLVAGAGDTDNASFNISGTSLRAGDTFDFETKSSYSIRVRSTDSKGNFFDEVFTISVTDVADAPSGSTFAGWSSNAPVTSELVGKYGIGGATNSSAASERPEPGLDSNTLSLSAVVRTNDAKLKVEGEAGGSLTNWSTNGVSMSPSADTNGVPEGHQRQVFSVDRTNSPTRQFLRLKATLE